MKSDPDTASAEAAINRVASEQSVPAVVCGHQPQANLHHCQSPAPLAQCVRPGQSRQLVDRVQTDRLWLEVSI